MDPDLATESRQDWNDEIIEAQTLVDAARDEPEAMARRLESAQKKQTAQEFVQRSYVTSQLSALKSILSIKEADATDHKSKIAQPVSLRRKVVTAADRRSRGARIS